ncbi:hypothetical protein ACTTAM_10860 [Rhodobacter capsulatus]|uniref:hypothetical protein n=1 Tax=Rhodobacter capsulatus TaxID=1061 RepID=UPI004028DD1D
MTGSAAFGAGFGASATFTAAVGAAAGTARRSAAPSSADIGAFGSGRPQVAQQISRARISAEITPAIAAIQIPTEPRSQSAKKIAAPSQPPSLRAFVWQSVSFVDILPFLSLFPCRVADVTPSRPL